MQPAALAPAAAQPQVQRLSTADLIALTSRVHRLKVDHLKVVLGYLNQSKGGRKHELQTRILDYFKRLSDISVAHRALEQAEGLV